MIYPFSSQEIPSLPQVGGKARALIEMSQAGFPVPAGFVLSVAFFRWWTELITSGNLWSDFLGSATREACIALRQSAARLRFTLEQRAAFERFTAEMPANALLAVRSSSPQEDLSLTSFAGQYETVLGAARSELEDSIARVYSSMFDFRVVEYKRRNRLPVDDARIAVIVQRQIASEMSGIAFSHNPGNNAFDEAVINASFGLGEPLVSGRVTPDTYIVDKVNNNVIEKKISHKAVDLRVKDGGGTFEAANPDAASQALTDNEILEVAGLAAACEKHSGKPVDIEWAFEDGRLYLLQSRPVTTCNPLFPEMLTAAGEPKRLYLDLIILTQGFFEPFSVLGLDIWSRMMDAAKHGTMPQGEDGYLLNVGGREYAILSNMARGMGKRVFNLVQSYELPIREVIKSLDLEHEYRAPEKTAKMRRANRDTLKMGFSLAPRMIAGLLNPRKQRVLFEKISEETRRYYLHDMLEEGTFSEIVEHGNRKFAALCKEYLRVALAGMLSMNSLKKLFKNQGVGDLIALLAAASPTNPTAQMGRLMLHLATFEELQETAAADEFVRNLSNGIYSDAFNKAYHDYMQRFGARGLREVDVASARTCENPEAFFRQLKSMHVQNNNLFNLEKRKEAAYRQLYELAEAGGKGKQYSAHVEKVQMLGYRETPKYLLALMMGEFRKKALELGRRFVSQGWLETPDQVFDLTIAQVSWAEADTALELHSLREANLLPRRAVAHIKPEDFPKIVDSRGKIFRYTRQAGENDLAGEPISPGTVVGRARVLDSPYDKPLQKGEILVTRATEPSWTPIFINAAGVVLEIGGPLQHGAIIAREYGIPCVSGIDEATKLIKDGDMLEVDGSSGLVKMVDED